ncbi:MAG: hypothetical protein ABIT68_08860 [Sphingomicrobium sp.]
MSRFEGDFSAAGDAPLSTTELLTLLGTSTALSVRERQQAIACYLSAGEGWDEALKTLSGAFASDATQGADATDVKPNERAVNQRSSEYLQWPALKPAASNND